jgi:hypothetical protein
LDFWGKFRRGVESADAAYLASIANYDQVLVTLLGDVAAIYPIYGVDEANEKPNGANKYALRFPPGQLPPVNPFWSLTMYGMPESLLVANPIDRYA